MSNSTKPSLEEMMSETLRLTQEVHTMAVKTKKYMAIRAAMSIVYFILLIAPIVLAFIYLPPLLGPALDQMQMLINIGAPAGLNAGSTLDTKQLLELLEQSR